MPSAVGETASLTREREYRCLHHHLNFHHHPAASIASKPVCARHGASAVHLIANPPDNLQGGTLISTLGSKTELRMMKTLAQGHSARSDEATGQPNPKLMLLPLLGCSSLDRCC